MADAPSRKLAPLMQFRLALAEDLTVLSLALTLVIVSAWLGFALYELFNRRVRSLSLWLSVVLATVGILAVLLRPVRVQSRSRFVGARVAVLLDRSRRLLLPDEGSTREDRLRQIVKQLSQRFQGARLSFWGFAEGELTPFSPDSPKSPQKDESDLQDALRQLSRAAGERPQSVIVVSDGRFVRPSNEASDEELQRLLGSLKAPLHAVAVSQRAPRDAAVRAVHNAGAAVAHQPLALNLEVSCSGGLECGELPVVVRELRQGEQSAELAAGKVDLRDKESARLELQITLERAGTRLVEVAITPPEGDEVPDNDRRILTFNVARERVRLLHVAGRPTYDVRSLRTWLKANESVDLVAFFILRTRQSTPMTLRESDELALIPFPVHDLFTEHLPSFDAVVLQDIDAVTYELAQYLPAVERYVQRGGGIIMVGGPSSFAGGGYAGSSLERVMPAGMGDPNRPYDLAEFFPRYTDAGRAAPVLGSLRDLISEDLPKMVGSNLLGPPRDGAIVLWEHPARRVGEAAMPVLSLSDAGDGRSVALSVDGTHQLAFSEFAERTAGRAYGALWDGLLGWLMRDPRYEAARVELTRPCIAGEPAELRLTPLPGASGPVELEIEALGRSSNKIVRRAALPPSGPVLLEPGSLEPGGYSAKVRVGQAPATRFDFACERGGVAFSDSRPDTQRLQRLARLGGGQYVDRERVSQLPVPAPTEVATERESAPLLPQWLWALLAALGLGWHWIERRRAGLA